MYRAKIGKTSPDELERGASFATRTALSEALGGSTYKGISYNAATDYVVLAPGGSGVDTHNYKNRWLEKDNRYLYFGEWFGCRDMRMAAGNQAMKERSPRLFLFLQDDDGAYVLEGRFRYESHKTESVIRPLCGHRHNAIVFTLVRAG